MKNIIRKSFEFVYQMKETSITEPSRSIRVGDLTISGIYDVSEGLITPFIDQIEYEGNSILTPMKSAGDGEIPEKYYEAAMAHCEGLEGYSEDKTTDNHQEFPSMLEVFGSMFNPHKLSA